MAKRKFNKPDVPGLFRRLILSWLLAVLAEVLLLPNRLRDLSLSEGLARMDLARVVLLTCGSALGLICVSLFVKTDKLERWGIVSVFVLLSAVLLPASFSWAFLAVCALITCILIYYALRGWDGTAETAREGERAGKTWVLVTAGLAGAFFLFVCAWTLGRYYCFNTPSYDFGIFSQMFYSMSKTGLPMTTLERDGLLSHFAVHVSPIYYLMLPFYMFVPSPATLQALQVAVMVSAVIPLWMIGKRHRLGGFQRTLLCALLLFFPAFSGGVGYDLHENCFLTPLILWIFYGIDSEKLPVTCVAALLTLTVKEDAAVYVAVIALWLIVRSLVRFSKRGGVELLTGIGLLAVSLGWFLAVTGYLAKSGDGVMTYRYENFMYDGSGSLITVLKSVVMNPMKALFECVDTEKLRFIAMTLLPLLGLPFFTRRYERFILLIPYLLINLMSDYTYQHDLFFQYSFGSTAFLLYLTAVNLSELKWERLRLPALLSAAFVSALCFSLTVIPRAAPYPENALIYRGYYGSIRDALDTVPEDASVSATTFLTSYLSRRETLYDVRYCSREHLLETEYVVLKVSSTGDYTRYNGYDNLVKILEDNGYSQWSSLGDILVIYRKNP